MKLIAGISLLALVTAGLLSYRLTYASGLFRIMDYPNTRSLHNTPVPRTGGLAIWPGMLAGIIATVLVAGWRDEIAWITSAAIIVGVVSFIDDRSHVPIILRLVIHLLAAGLLMTGQIFLQSVELPNFSYGLTINAKMVLSGLFIIWMINLYNFMDGMDGFAGGMAVIGFGTLGLLGHLASNDDYVVICCAIAAASAGFLVWNFPPARIFMGDIGSSTLGLLAAALSLWADHDGLFPLWLSMLVFSPFIFDATLTLMCRTLKGERIWEAHRGHYYQRLVQSGWSHRRTVLWEYGLMLLCSTSALAAYHAPVTTQWLILGGMAGVYLLAIIGVRGVERRYAASQTLKIFL